LEDATGDSAIIEYINGKIVIHHGPQYTVMTNEPAYDFQIKNLQKYRYFGGTLPLPGDIDSISRFVRCSAFLKTLTEPNNLEETVGNLLGVIRTVQAPFGSKDTSNNQTEDAWPTRWVSVADLTNLVYYFNSTSTPNIIWVDLKSLNFAADQSVQSINPHDPLLVGNVSKKFK
jgi:penicillin V acylase-like amidase (Ntn superfamily)